MSDDSDYIGSAGTYVEDIEIFEYDEYVALYGDLPLDGIEETEG